MSEVGDVFDDWAMRGRAQGMEEGHGQTAGPLLARLELDKGDRFLDLGCGNGWACRFAVGRGATALGIDASAKMVDEARRLADGLAGVRFEKGDFAHLPVEDASFDVVWSMEALYYAPDPDAVLKEVCRVLGPGGVFHMVIDHYTENEASHGWPEQTGLAMVLRSEAQWVEALREAGLVDVQPERLRATSADAEAWKQEQGSLHLAARRPR